MNYLAVETRQLPYAHGGPPVSGSIRVQPQDFVVEEVNRFDMSGQGEHLWLLVEKQERTTDAVAKLLARVAGIAPRNVSFAGFKDKNALTRQWFSLQLPGKADPDLSAVETQAAGAVRVISAVRHSRKLQRGALSGNRFVLHIRNINGDRDTLGARCRQLAHAGFPNYFMEQRFGRDGDNIATFFNKSPQDRGNNPVDSILLSSLRSFLFNEVLAQRVTDGSWNQVRGGDVMILNGTHSIFVAEETDMELPGRLASGDIHITGPMWGQGELASRATTAQLEREVAARYTDVATALEQADLRQDRRSFRHIPRDFEFSLADNVLRLSFSLPAGAYATALLRELVNYNT